MKKNHQFRLFAVGLVAVLMVALSAPVYAAAYPDQDDNGKMWYQTNLDWGGEYTYAFDIQGYVDGDLFSTTYENEGYSVFLQDGDDEVIDTETGANGVERIYGELGLTTRLSFVNDGSYVKVEYTIRNTTSIEKTFSLATTGDTQIGDADDAPIEVYNDSSIIMRDGDAAQFNIVCRDAIGVTDVDSIWIGYYDEQYDNMFNGGPLYYDEDDSGLAFSWIDRTLTANGAETFSVLYSVGAVNAAPILELQPLDTEVVLGKSLTIQGTVTDPDNTSGTKVYYVLDGGEPVLLYTFAAEPGDFSNNIIFPSSDDFVGEHELMLYAEDSLGALSSIGTTFLNVVAEVIDDNPTPDEDTPTTDDDTPNTDEEVPAVTDDSPETGNSRMLPVAILGLFGLLGSTGVICMRKEARSTSK